MFFFSFFFLKAKKPSVLLAHETNMYICRVTHPALEYSGFNIHMLAVKMHATCTAQLLKMMLKNALLFRPKL